MTTSFSLIIDPAVRRKESNFDGSEDDATPDEEEEGS